jgi:hypothetical protein
LFPCYNIYGHGKHTPALKITWPLQVFSMSIGLHSIIWYQASSVVTFTFCLSISGCFDGRKIGQNTHQLYQKTINILLAIRCLIHHYLVITLHIATRRKPSRYAPYLHWCFFNHD